MQPGSLIFRAAINLAEHQQQLCRDDPPTKHEAENDPPILGFTLAANEETPV